MKKGAWSLLFLFVLTAVAQVPPLPNDLLLVGASWNQAAKPQLNEWASYAQPIKQSVGVYSYTTYDAQIVKLPEWGWTLQTSTRTGIAIYLRSVGPFHLFGLGDAGVALAGKTAGGSFSGGGFIGVSLGRGFAVIFEARLVKTALSDRQPVYGLGFGWGK